MAKQERVTRKTDAKKDEEEDAPAAKSSDDLKAELDGILDEIDAVLEENAQDFVNAYVQKGGE